MKAKVFRKDGFRYEGEVLEETDTFIKIQDRDGVVNVNKDSIDEIRYMR